VNGTTTDLAGRVARTVREQRLFQQGDTLIVAISGGADSTALLDLLSGLPNLSLHLIAAHLNHCLRGPESDADEEFCRNLALRYAIPFESTRMDVKEYAAQQGLNLEDAGRRARIAFFDEVCTKWRATAVVLAHHADDQTETVLMRLLRGTGPVGLAGMPYRNGRGYLRPLLEITRPEIEAWLITRGLAWREDASNRDTAFLRNRIRHELLPLLEQYNPAIRKRLATTAALLADENEVLEQLAGNLAARACSNDGDVIRCDIAQLAGQPPALGRRLFRRMLEQLAGSLDYFSNRHITALEHLLESPRPNATLNLPLGVTAVREYGSLLLRRSSVAAHAAMDETIISGPGHYPLPAGGSLTVTIEPAPPYLASLPPDNAWFATAKAPFPWLVRTFRNGDRIVPLGMTGSKKVKDLFMDEKIPLPRRRRIPLLFSNDTLIWVCGLRSSNLARVEPASTGIARVVYSDT
jgi:tRNA(Ile)-lysidine synthase